MSEHVKERPDATSCSLCGRPTWSNSEICAPCRQRLPPTPPRVEPPSPTIKARREVLLADDGRIAEDISCRACGYNLRGLETTAECPECSLSVSHSTRADLLRFRDPRWLDSLANGTRLVIIGLLAGVGVGLVLAGVMLVLAASGTAAVVSTVSIGALMGAAVTVVTIIGVWLVTAPDPGLAAGQERPASARLLARWCVMAEIAAVPLQMAINSSGTGLWTGMPWPVLVVSALLGLVAVVGKVAALIYLGSLASKIPRPSLTRQTKTVAWGYGVCQGFGVGLMALLLLGLQIPQAPGSSWAGVTIVGGFLACGIGVGSMVFGVWALVLLFLFAGAFRRVAVEARMPWTVAGECST